MSDVVERAKKLLRESTAPWRVGQHKFTPGGRDTEGGGFVVATDAPSENRETGFYEGLHLVAESIFHPGDKALIAAAPEVIAELVKEVERLRR